MSFYRSFPARSTRTRVRSGAVLCVVTALACDTPRSALDPTAESGSFHPVDMTLDLPTVALVLGAAGSTLHAVRPNAGGLDTVAATWRSSDERVVTVDADGRLTAERAGDATVWARAGRDSAGSAVTVSAAPASLVNAATVSVRPASVTLTVGVPQQFTASVQTIATGATVTAATVATAAVPTAAPSAAAATPAVTWTSSAPAVAAVSSNGTVVPISAGVAVITAAALGSRAAATVVVAPPRSTAARRVELAVMRFDGGSGPVLVSNGVPFARGAVTEATLGQVHVFVNRVEQPVFVRALGGRWPDGSLRAALVQFDYTIPDARTIPAYLAIGGARTLAPRAERAAAAAPVAAALPTSSAYLISTGLVGAVYDPTTTRAPTTIIAQYEGDFARLSALDWERCGANWSCGRTAGYDRPYILYQAWVRTANPTYWQHASAIVANYVDGYLAPARGQPAPWWANTEGTALHYWATGDERTRGYVHAAAASLAYQVRANGGWGLGPTPDQRGDDRMRAKALTAMMDARAIDARPTATGNPLGGEAAFYSKHMAAHPLSEAVSLVLATQRPSGAFGGFQYKGGQKNFMVGMLLTSLIRYHDEVAADPRIPTAVQRAVDYMTANEWVAGAQGFKYCTVIAGPDDGTQPEPGLNNLVAPAVAWTYFHTGDARYATMVDRLMLANASAERSWWAASGKAFDQGFAHVFNTMSWRNR